MGLVKLEDGKRPPRRSRAVGVFVVVFVAAKGWELERAAFCRIIILGRVKDGTGNAALQPKPASMGMILLLDLSEKFFEFEQCGEIALYAWS